MERKSQPKMHKQKDYFFITDKIGIVIFTLLNASIQRVLLLQIMTYPSSCILEESRLFKMYFLCTGSSSIVSKTSNEKLKISQFRRVVWQRDSESKFSIGFLFSETNKDSKNNNENDNNHNLTRPTAFVAWHHGWIR